LEFVSSVAITSDIWSGNAITLGCLFKTNIIS
jgi:hypothetical protein